jgi:hypothetical protein
MKMFKILWFPVSVSVCSLITMGLFIDSEYFMLPFLYAVTSAAFGVEACCRYLEVRYTDEVKMKNQATLQKIR